MTRDEIIAKLRANAAAIQAEGATGLALFGSRARGDMREDSDIDVLIEVPPDSKFSLLNLIGIEHIITDVTGLPAQATLRRSIEPHMAERVADDLVEIF